MFFRRLIGPPLHLYCKLKYHIKIEKIKENPKGQYVVLFNHQTAFDQFFVSLSFHRPVYFIASEDLFSKGWVSRLISWIAAPIPFCKSTSDASAIMTCMRIAKAGGSVGLSPEGNRTYSGTTEHMKPSIVKLVRSFKLPLALYRIEGGYGVQPRWSHTLRRGKMRSYVSRVVTPEEYNAMSDDELFLLIQKELYVDERKDLALFYSKKSAEYLERAMYVCPRCGLSAFETKNDIISCKRCHLSARYLPNKQLQGIDEPFPFTYVKDWYDAQNDFVRHLDLAPYQDQPIYEDPIVFYENIYCKRKELIDKKATLRVYADRFEIKTETQNFVFRFSELVGTTVLGKNKFNIYRDARIYQVDGGERFNAVKYLNLYHHALNCQNGTAEVGFLGL